MWHDLCCGVFVVVVVAVGVANVRYFSVLLSLLCFLLFSLYSPFINFLPQHHPHTLITLPTPPLSILINHAHQGIPHHKQLHQRRVPGTNKQTQTLLFLPRQNSTIAFSNWSAGLFLTRAPCFPLSNQYRSLSSTMSPKCQRPRVAAERVSRLSPTSPTRTRSARDNTPTR